MATMAESTVGGAVGAGARGSAVDGLSYEQARDELIAVLHELEQGAITLEHSLELWERGEALAQRCEQWLLGAKARLDAARGGGSATPTPPSALPE